MGKLSKFLGPRMYIDFSDDAQYPAKLEELMREIHRAPAVVKPPLGDNPFKGEVIEPAEPVRVAGPSGATAAGVPILNGEWFQAQHRTATGGLAKLNIDSDAGSQLTGTMEVRFGLHNGLNKSQIELLSAVRASQIQTFGWPIAVLLENRPEYRPRPFGDGIRAELAIAEWSDFLRLLGRSQERRFLPAAKLLRRYTRQERALFQHAYRAGDGSAHVCGQALHHIGCCP